LSSVFKTEKTYYGKNDGGRRETCASQEERERTKDREHVGPIRPLIQRKREDRARTDKDQPSSKAQILLRVRKRESGSTAFLGEKNITRTWVLRKATKSRPKDKVIARVHS